MLITIVNYNGLPLVDIPDDIAIRYNLLLRKCETAIFKDQIAIEFDHGLLLFFDKYNRLHRTDGPAVKYKLEEEYWIDGKKQNFNEFGFWRQVIKP